MNQQKSSTYAPIVSAELSGLVDDVKGPPNTQLAFLNSHELVRSAVVALNELFRRAKAGGDESTDYVFRLAMQASRLLTDLVEDPSPLLLDIAKRSPQRPFFYSPKPGFLDPFRPVLDRLQIGKDCQLNVNPRSRWSWQGESRSWAMKIFLFVCSVKNTVEGHKTDRPDAKIKWTELTKAAAELPPLTQTTANLWMAKVGWPLVLKCTEDKPEKHPRLRKLGMHREHHTETAKAGSKTSESNIRDGIKKLITQALSGMASHP